MKTMILWDIDHTLVDVGALSGDIYSAVFSNVTGRPMERIATMAGRTDLAIITEALVLHGIPPTDETRDTFARALAAAFAERDGDIRAYGRALPGARSALATLAKRADVLQSVLTGNMRPIAVGKLKAFGLDAFIDFEVGAYGLDDVARPPLAQLARERARRKYGHDFIPTNTVIIGDTPSDVSSAHEGGARVVAVATGSTDEKDLRSAGAEMVLPDLADTDAVIRAVLGVSAVC